MVSAGIPKIIYGTAWKKEATTGLVVKAVLQGFRAIDTAGQPKHYREDLVGAALQILEEKHGIKREELWIQSKFTSVNGHDMSKPLPYNRKDPVRKQVSDSFRNSLLNLHTTYIDSYILHSPLDTMDATLEAWSVLMALQDEGKVRMIGVSNANDVKVIKALSSVRKVQVVQNRWYERNDWNKDVVKYCRENGVMFQSFWTLTGSPNLLRHDAVLALANEKECTPEQIVFRVAQMHGVTPLAGSKDAERMRDGVETEKIDLSEDSLQSRLNELEKLIFA